MMEYVVMSTFFKSTVMYQLKRRSQNVRFQEKKSLQPALPSSSTTTNSGSLAPSDKDDTEILEEIKKELRRKKPNYVALKEMQKLTFPKRKDFVEKITDGRTTVESVLSTYPFLENDEMVI